MLPVLHQKWKTAGRVYRKRGVGGIFRIVAERTRFFLTTQLNFLTGNQVRLGDMAFFIDPAVVSRRMKSELLLDLYERPEREAVKSFLDPALPVIELGGGLGVIACTANKQLIRPQAHVVVEANPDLIPLLTRNRDLNNCRFEIVHAAIGYEGDEITLYLNERFVLSSTKAITTRAVRLPAACVSTLIEQISEGNEQVTLICDIEGAENDLVTHEFDTLTARAATIIIEIHPEFLDAATIEAMLARLEDGGFRLVHQEGKLHVFQHQPERF